MYKFVFQNLYVLIKYKKIDIIILEKNISPLLNILDYVNFYHFILMLKFNIIFLRFIL